MMKIAFLEENKTTCEGIVAEHGLAVFIDAGDTRILFDCGASDLFAHNAEVLGVDLRDVDHVVISHGHYDHTGGVPAFCRINKKAPVHLHENAFRSSFALIDGEPDGIISGIRWSEDELSQVKDRIAFTKGPVALGENVKITGTVPLEPGFEPTERFYYEDAEGVLREDDMSHEQCLVVRQPEGLYIFSGCSHRGAVAALRAGKNMFPGEPVALFVAGMHLYSASAEERSRCVRAIAAEGAGVKIMPVHCTGFEALCLLKRQLGDACIIAGAGDVYEF